MRNLIVALLVSLLIALVTALSPYPVAWNSTHSYGPDGPWPVVTIRVGTDANDKGHSTVDLHPGGIKQHMILAENFCSGQSIGGCAAAAASLYDVDASYNVIRNMTPGESGFVWQWGSEIGQTLSAVAYNEVDVISLNGAQGPKSYFTVGNSSISAEAWTIERPNGANYSTQVGTLSLSARQARVSSISQTCRTLAASTVRLSLVMATQLETSHGTHSASITALCL